MIPFSIPKRKVTLFGFSYLLALSSAVKIDAIDPPDENPILCPSKYPE